MSANPPAEPPPSYEEAQLSAPYPAYPQQPGGNPDAPKPYGYSDQGVNQPYPVQQGFPQQQYPYGPSPPGAYPNQSPYPTQGPYPSSGPGQFQAYNYPTAVASYNQQGVVLQPGMQGPNQMAMYRRRRRIIFTVAAVIFAFIFLSVIIRIIA